MVMLKRTVYIQMSEQHRVARASGGDQDLFQSILSCCLSSFLRKHIILEQLDK